MEFPFLALDKAANWEDFNQALRRYPVPGRILFTRMWTGNIGYHAAGMLPNRQGCRGDVPADGAKNDCVWNGVIPYDDLPQTFNPQCGMIVSANQNPFPDDYRYTVNGGFAPPYRAREIRALLFDATNGSPPRCWASRRTCTRPIYISWLRKPCRPGISIPDRIPRFAKQRKTLRNWNGQMEKKTAAPMVVSLIDAELRKAAAKAAAPGAESDYAARLAPVVIERLLRERPANWFPSYDDLLVTRWPPPSMPERNYRDPASPTGTTASGSSWN